MGFMRKRILFVLATFLMLFAVNTANATPVIDDTKDYSNDGEIIVTYENGFIIESHMMTDEERQLSQSLQKPHTHPSKTRHSSLTQHSHSIRDIVVGTDRKGTWRPTEVWTRNNLYPDNADWPTVSWTTSQSVTIGSACSVTVGVPKSLVTTEVGAEFTKSHTVSTSTTRTFKVPYQKDGRVKVEFYRPYRSLTCVTTYIYAGPPITYLEETGAGSALGKPKDIVCSLETKSF